MTARPAGTAAGAPDTAAGAPDTAASGRPLRVADLATRFSPVPGYLNAATLGLPPRRTVAVLRDALTDWESGRSRPTDFDTAVARARASYARLVDVDGSWVSVGSQVSVLVGQVAASLPAGEVLTVDGDFASVLFPFLVQQSRGVTVRQVPLERLADEVRPGTTVVAYSLVQSADGRIAEAERVSAAAAAVGALTVCDVTQAVGWLPVSAAAHDVTVCGTYKWLCTPRGVAFLTVSPAAAQRLLPVNAGWYAGESVWDSVYGPDMRLAGDARRFDVSPAWFGWVGAAPALELFADADPEDLRSHGAGLADALRARLGVAPTGSAIVATDDPGGELGARLAGAGCTVAGRAGRVRLAFHVWNDEEDVERAAGALLSR